MGRPTRYTNILADTICDMIATTSLGMKEICELNKIDYSTVRGWIAKETHPFSDRYTRAKDKQLELLAEEIITISDDGSNDLMLLTKPSGEQYEVENKEVVNRSKLRVESRKWLLAKLKPKIYGDAVKLTGDGENPLVVNVITGIVINP